MTLFAEAGFWTWAEKLIDPSTLVALGTLVGLYYTHRSNSAKIKEVKADVSDVMENVHVIEKATNSMKDALVQATGDAAFLKGKQEERTNPEGTKAVSSGIQGGTIAAAIRADIEKVPEKTATKVVEKLKEGE